MASHRQASLVPAPTPEPKNKGGRPRKYPDLVPVDSKLLQEKKIPTSLGRFIEKVLKIYAPHMLPVLMEETRKGAAVGDKDSLERIARMFGLVGNNKGTAVFVNTQAIAGASATSVTGSGFESVIRKMHSEPKTIDIKAG